MTVQIVVEPAGGGEFAVEVNDGDSVAAVTVVASERFLADLDVPDAPVDEIVREAVGLLLDRRPAAALGEDVDLEELAGDDEEFVAELQSRLGF
jgi:hypothetical protein